MSNKGASGGTVRLVIDPDGRVRGSMNDSAVTHSGDTVSPRVATVVGTANGGTLKLVVSWTGSGAAEKYSGACSNKGFGSLGANLVPDGSNAANMMVLSLHEQGVSGSPPFGTPATTQQPDFQKRWTGTWIVNWFDGGPDYGSGTVRISEDGVMNGALVDDAFNSTEWNEPVQATLTGKIGPDGAVVASIAWSSGRAGWGMQGKAYFSSPETFQIQFSPTAVGDVAGQSITMTFHRGQ